MKKKLEVAKRNAETAFAVTPQHGFELGLQRFSKACRDAVHSLKEKVSNELSARFASVRPEIVRLAVNEATALASTTAFPSLFLPTLAEEKVFLASTWQMKQQAIQKQTWLRAA